MGRNPVGPYHLGCPPALPSSRWCQSRAPLVQTRVVHRVLSSSWSRCRIWVWAGSSELIWDSIRPWVPVRMPAGREGAQVCSVFLLPQEGSGGSRATLRVLTSAAARYSVTFLVLEMATLLLLVEEEQRALLPPLKSLPQRGWSGEKGDPFARGTSIAAPQLPLATLGHPIYLGCPNRPRHPYLPQGAKGPENAASIIVLSN